MKGVHPILSHSVMLIIGLVAMGMILVSVSSTFSTTKKNLVRTESEYIAESIKLRIVEIYGTVESQGNFSGNFSLNFPETIGDQKYTISLSNDTLSVSVPVDKDNMEINRTLGINATISGEKSMPSSIMVEKNGETIIMDLI